MSEERLAKYRQANAIDVKSGNSGLSSTLMSRSDAAHLSASTHRRQGHANRLAWHVRSPCDASGVFCYEVPGLLLLVEAISRGIKSYERRNGAHHRRGRRRQRDGAQMRDERECFQKDPPGEPHHRKAECDQGIGQAAHRRRYRHPRRRRRRAKAGHRPHRKGQRPRW